MDKITKGKLFKAKETARKEKTAKLPLLNGVKEEIIALNAKEKKPERN